MPDIENATIRMYEDISLTDELTDDPAQKLLRWGEARLVTMVENIPDDEQFEDRFKQLRKLIKSINRFTGRRHNMPSEEQIGYVWKLLDTAKELGYEPNYGNLNTYMDKQKSLDDVQNIALLTHFIETGEISTDDETE